MPGPAFEKAVQESKQLTQKPSTDELLSVRFLFPLLHVLSPFASPLSALSRLSVARSPYEARALREAEKNRRIDLFF